MQQTLSVYLAPVSSTPNTDKKENGTMKRNLTVRMALAMVAVVAMATAQAVNITWTASPYTNIWDGSTTSRWTPAQVPTSADDVLFPTFGSGHYTSQTVTISGTQTANSITFRPNEVDYLHLAGGDLTGVAGGITVDNVTANWASWLYFDRNGNYSFTGDVTVKGGNRVFYGTGISAAGTYSLGSGAIDLQKSGTYKADFNYEPTVTGTTLTNAIHVDSSFGTDAATFNWGNAPTFTGNLTLDGNIYFNSVGGGNEYFDWNGNVILTDDRTIIGGVRDLAGGRTGGLHFGGQFQGPTHALTLDFQNSPNVGMQATSDSAAWNVGDLVLTNGTGDGVSANSPNLLVYTTNATDDHFALLRGNGGKVTIQNGAQLLLRRGSIEGDDVHGGAGLSRIAIDQQNAAYDVRIVNSPLRLGNTDSRVNLLRICGGSVPAVGSFQGDIIVDNGGTLSLETLYGHLARHDAGNLELRGGSTLNAAWSGNNFWSAGYRLGSGSQQILLGDGNGGTVETITFRGQGDPGSGVFCFGTDTGNVVDDGSTILRYESSGSRRFNMGWTDLASVQALTYSSNTVKYQFRGGSDGTIFAPQSATYDIGAIGPSSGTVFTANSPTSLVTSGTVGFYNSNNATYTGHRGNPGAIVISSGGTFDLQSAGTVVASTVTVQGTGSISGIGTFNANVTVTDGTVAPGNSAGTLYVNGNFAFGNGADYDWEMGSSFLNGDVIDITGIMALVNPSDEWTLNITLAGPEMLTTVGNYLLATADGGFSTDFLAGLSNVNVTGLTMIKGWLTTSGNDLFYRVNKIPEPTTGLILMLGAALAARRRRAARG